MLINISCHPTKTQVSPNYYFFPTKCFWGRWQQNYKIFALFVELQKIKSMKENLFLGVFQMKRLGYGTFYPAQWFTLGAFILTCWQSGSHHVSQKCCFPTFFFIARLSTFWTFYGAKRDWIKRIHPSVILNSAYPLDSHRELEPVHHRTIVNGDTDLESSYVNRYTTNDPVW